MTFPATTNRWSLSAAWASRLGYCLSCAMGVLLGGGCRQALGDYDFAEQSPSAVVRATPGNEPSNGTGGSGMESDGPDSERGPDAQLSMGDRQQAGVECAPGLIACNGAALQVCTTQGNGWVTLQICDSGALCRSQPAQCSEATCETGELRCDGKELLLCNADRTGWELLTECPSAAHCNVAERRCTDGPCQAGDLQCNGSELQVCPGDEQGWEGVTTCSSQALCVSSLIRCESEGECTAASFQCAQAVCQPGQRRCEGTQLQECLPSLDGWETVEECETAALCNEAAPECSSPLCAPGQLGCSGQFLQRCNADRTGFETIDDCDTAAFCDPTADQCREVPCQQGELRCNGAQPERCLDNRSGFEPVGGPCATPGLCSVANGQAQCREPQCELNQYQCVGAELQRCNLDRDGFERVSTCETASLCNAGLRRCDPRACNPDQARCSGGSLERCAAGLHEFELEEQCGSPGECDAVAGACREPCTGGTRCNGPVLESCSDPLVGWRPVANCLTAQLCNADQARCEPAECRAGDHQCVGQRLELCAPGLDGFVLREQCAPGSTCDATGQQCDTCQPGSRRCVAGALLRCRDNGQGFEPQQQCGVGLCNVELGCLECRIGSPSRCVGNRVIGCNAQGQEQELDVCANAAHCSQTLAGASCEEPTCQLGQLSCTPQGEVLSCNAQRTDFVSQVPPIVCAEPELCNVAVPGGCEEPDAPPPGTGPPPPPPEELPDYDFEFLLGPAVLGVGPLTTDAPTAWDDVDTSPWTNNAGTVLGPSLTAATDRAGFEAFTEPGMFFAASAIVDVDPASTLDLLEFEASCSFGSRNDYSDPFYTGLFDVWENCGPDGSTLFVVAAAPANEDFLIIVIINTLAPRDLEARDRIWATFVVQE